MGKLILKYWNGKQESFKCKSRERAKEIFDKRPSAIKWSYFEVGERIPIERKKIARHTPASLEELELLMKRQGLIF
jgi:hypothetical protein